MEGATEGHQTMLQIFLVFPTEPVISTKHICRQQWYKPESGLYQIKMFVIQIQSRDSSKKKSDQINILKRSNQIISDQDKTRQIPRFYKIYFINNSGTKKKSLSPPIQKK